MKRLVFLLAFALFCTVSRDADALLCVPLLGCSCSVSATQVQFNGVSPFGGNVGAVGQVTVDCTGVADLAPSVVIKLNKGVWGTLSTRQMRDGNGDLLHYNLYTTGLYSTIWGDGTGTTAAQNVSGGLLALGHWQASQTVYGRVAPIMSTKPGSYSDTVVVRIDW